jgi:hypothetical protein
MEVFACEINNFVVLMPCMHRYIHPIYMSWFVVRIYNQIYKPGRPTPYVPKTSIDLRFKN